MQIDFHYYCIGALARAAGFNSEEALIIAYASQYVDNSTESELIRLEVKGGDIRFDPVRTAHSGLESFSWSAQKRVFIPFHFIPPKPFIPRKNEFSFVTEPGSSFAELLLEEADKEENPERRLCRIGIALHTFADSWSHQNFSGRLSRKENDVENIHEWKENEYDHLEFENILFDLLPQIGHAEAGFFPDLTYQKWKYDSGHPSKTIKRDNTEEFLHAAEVIYKKLRQFARTDTPVKTWDEIKDKIHELLSEEYMDEPTTKDKLTLPFYRAYHALDVEKRCEKWKEAFGELFGEDQEYYNYNKEDWRKKALEGETAWDSFSERDWDQESFVVQKDFWDSLWVHFHRAALRQRHFVLEHMP